jgi:O-antigen ligase
MGNASAASSRLLRLRRSTLASWGYALWLHAITVVFFLDEGQVTARLAVTVGCGAVFMGLQLLLGGTQLSHLRVCLACSALHLSAVVFSYVAYPDPRFALTNFGGLALVLVVASVAASAKHQGFLSLLSSAYGVSGIAVLAIAVLTNDYRQGRLFGGISPTYWGLVATSVSVSAIAIRRRWLAALALALGVVVLYLASARGAMLGLAAAAATATLVRLHRTDWRRASVALAAATFGVIAFVALFGFPDWLLPVLRDDVLRLDDPYRGLGSGFTGRVNAWLETLDLWKTAPYFGIGYRAHEEHVLSLSSSHNAYLAVLVDTGIYGLVVYILLLVLSVSKAARGARDADSATALALLVAYATLGLFERRALNSGNAFSILFLIAQLRVIAAAPAALFSGVARSTTSSGRLDQ